MIRLPLDDVGSPRSVVRLIPFVIALLTAAACATSPRGRKQFIIIPDDQMNAMGAQAFQDLKNKERIDPDLVDNTYVKCIADAITDTLEKDGKHWEVVVFKNEEPNAFALPGRKIGVHSGMLKVATTPAELATVIGHEVGHVLARHGNERVSESFAAQGGLALIQITMSGRGPKYDLIMAGLGLGAQFGVLLPHSRTQESEADLIGLELMAKAGFDPSQSIDLWQNMEKTGRAQPPEFLSTHPSHGTRIGDLRAHLPKANELYQAAKTRPSCRR